MARKNKKNKKILILIIILFALLLISLIVLLRNLKKADGSKSLNSGQATYIEEEKKKEEIKSLSEKSEQQRMQYYCGKFFNLIDNQNYESAYELLYSDYKENFFPTLANFKRYFQEYFPSDFSLSYENMERLGDIYVLTVSLSDLVNRTSGHNFKFYVVIQENNLDDFVISFSRNSAVEEEE